jgi:hypothetical protein
VFLLSVFGTIAVATNRERHRELIPWVVAVIAATEMFFIFIMVVHNNPSTRSCGGAGGRQGLNPLLQNFYMAIHPPSLYTGFVAMTIPYAFGMAALDHRPPRRRVAARRAALDDDRLAVPDLRPHARHALGRTRSWAGAVLGLGSGRERGPAAVVHGDRRSCTR